MSTNGSIKTIAKNSKELIAKGGRTDTNLFPFRTYLSSNFLNFANVFHK